MSLTKTQLTEIAENLDANLHCYIDLNDWTVKSIPDPNRHNRDDESWNDTTEETPMDAPKSNRNLLILRGVPKMENHQIMTRFIPTVDGNTVKDQLRAATKKKRAYKKFKDVLYKFPTVQQDWFDFNIAALSDYIQRRIREATTLKTTPTQFLHVTPVLPTADIVRDTEWYKTKLGFSILRVDEGYAVLRCGGIHIHLQWHADTDEDPLLGGSVAKFFVKNIETLFEEFVEKGIVPVDKLRKNTPWNTHEFGLYDLNGNGIFFVEDIDE